MEEVGEAIREARVAIGLSQSGLAERMRAAGFDQWRQTTVSRVERDMQRVRVREAIAMEEILGQPIFSSRIVPPDPLVPAPRVPNHFGDALSKAFATAARIERPVVSSALSLGPIYERLRELSEQLARMADHFEPHHPDAGAAEAQTSSSRQKNCPGAATVSAVSSGAYSNYDSAVREPDSTSLAELTTILSADRFGTYLVACNGDRDLALRLYAWNIEVTSAFWGSFHVLEVALRNAIHRELTALAGRPDWWAGQLPLHASEQRQIATAVAHARRDHGAAVQPGHVIAELSLGFWTGLLANRYHQRLWVPALSRAFPNLSGTRRDLHRQLESLRKLRNRAAHHEPIYARNLGKDHDQLVAVLGAISPEAVRWLTENSRIPTVLARHSDVLAGRAATRF